MVVLKLATPLLLVLASSAAIVTALPVALVSIPSPPVKVSVPPKATEAVPLSDPPVIELFSRLELGTFARAITPVPDE